MNKVKALYNKARAFCVSKFYKISAAVYAGVASVPFVTMVANAADSNTTSIDKFLVFACDWLIKIGAVVALVGAVMFALGWQREDAEGKSRGLMTVMAGFMLVAVGASPQIFGLTSVKPTESHL